MEDVIQTYLRPYDANRPVVCFDEASRQLFGEVRERQPAVPRRTAKVDYEYERKGTCNLFLMCEPLRGWRSVRVTDRRTRKDYAECLQQLVDVHYPHAQKVVLVQDNLNTHSGGSLYERDPPAEALRILNRIEFHYTPKHGSWVNMAESEIGILGQQCLDRRLDGQTKLAHEVAIWQDQRNHKRVRVHWTFTLAAARQKLRKLYPTIED
ncbi:Mobile element protein [Fimbriiglobus ruber]|uniref:Mobile element protein n=1 Tax=Fimbriiglobus ruber TaxID=1908690 RepID=A0A225DFJ6_9BACT|nr:Mobile element protein [Fimbriiglobus ruber]